MKVKNIMFSGAMASILMIGGAYAAVDDSALTTVSFVKGGVNHAIDTAVTNISASGSLVGYTATTDATSGRKVGTISLDTDLSKYDNTVSKFVDEDDMSAAIEDVTDVIGTGFSSSSTVASAISALQSAVGSSVSGTLGSRVDTLETTVGDADSGLVKDVADLNTTLTKLDGTDAVEGSVKNLIAAEKTRAEAAYDAKGAAAAVQGSTTETVASVNAKVGTNATNIGTLQDLVGNTAVAIQISNAIDGLALDETYEATGTATAAIGKLDATVKQDADTNGVSAQVVETDGKLTSVTVAVDAATAVTAGSSKLVTSGAVATALGAKQDTIAGNGYVSVANNTVSLDSSKIATSWE